MIFYPGGISETEILLAYGGVRFASKMGQLAGNHFITITDGLENLAAARQDRPVEGRAGHRDRVADLKMSVLVAIPVYEREPLVRLCLPTVAELLLPEGSQIVLFDDASQSFDAATLIAELNLAASVERSAFRIGPDAMVYFIWSYFLAGPHSKLLFLDSDLIVNPRAVLDGLDYLATFPGLLSLYNSRRHRPLREEGDLVIKSILGNAGTLWRRELAQEVKAELTAGQYIDDRYSRLLRASKVPMAATRRSRMQHLGHVGTNNRYLGDFDHGVNFIPDTARQFAAIAAVYDELMLNQQSYLPPRPATDIPTEDTK